jgi:hypothetical protein
MTAYHFVGATLRDGRPVPADGEWLEHVGPIVMCETGLHASLRPWHALLYAPGETLCRVEMDGDIVHGNDKLVARRRRIVQRADVTDALWVFSRDEALRVAHLWECPPLVRQFLETGDESLRAAAWAAASAAARDAACAAAWAAACAAAWDAASAAARAAAWAAASAATRAAARDVACDARGERFDAAMHALVGGAS